MVLVVDAANVIGSVPDGWWRDRPGAAKRLVERLAGRPTVVVLEGRFRQGVPEGEYDGVKVVHADGIGDDTIASLAGPEVTVVTADRGLAQRVRAAGGDVVGPSFLTKPG
jgi:uncharacterized protein YaiI (UPF0178 family)